ncbi:endoribonuclease Dicer protein [Trifolium repens]|nr:endoribonuclease Dicer protein [Trifolium repens]
MLLGCQFSMIEGIWGPFDVAMVGMWHSCCCPIQAIHVQGDTKFLRNIACLEACKQLHKIGALTDYLIPSIVVEEAEVEEFELKQNFSYDITVQNIFLATRVKLDPEIGGMQFDMCFDRGSLSVKLKFKGSINLSSDQVLLCKRFQVNVLGILMNYKIDKETLLDKCCLEDDLEIDYLLLPSIAIDETPAVDWLTISSIHPSKVTCRHHETNIWTAKGLVFGCILQNALVCTPHNGRTYITTNIMELDGNSPLEVGDGEVTTYKKYFGQKHGIQLRFEYQRLLKARHAFPVKNYCHGHRQAKERDASKTFVELPPELCSIIILESLLVAFNFKKMHLDHCPQNKIQSFKVLEAMTTKSCKETFHYESLETLGDSFLKYAYSFRDRSLSVEAMTRGSYMLPDMPRCYQRLEYLGDSVLDYLITMHMEKAARFTVDGGGTQQWTAAGFSGRRQHRSMMLSLGDGGTQRYTIPSDESNKF